MPLIYQHNINDTTKAGIWHIEEPAEYFLSKVPIKRDVSHPHKRLQHLAGRCLLPSLFADFPLEEILIADTRKPFLENEKYHFSISHCGDYAAAIASSTNRVGVDIELITSKIERVKHKFLSAGELSFVLHHKPISEMFTMLTIMWGMKEAIFKWYGDGEIDFIQHMQIQPFTFNTRGGTADVYFLKNDSKLLQLHYRHFDAIVLSWVVS
ncbi:MAG: 4'-phosphopantetheinyl transferase superfamily protein [Sphingobacteriales bacterium]|nr:MAG: 4'-phosphopantetheinyl transferase superfamily protein [Sphingobacteriales bacterium]